RKKNLWAAVWPITGGRCSSSLGTAAAGAVAGGGGGSQSGLPPPVRGPAMSYMSFTATVSLASGPCAAPTMGAGKSCGTKALRKRCDISVPRALRAIPVEYFCAVPRHDAVVAENFLERALHVRDAVRSARQIRMAGDRHDLRPLGRLVIQAAELIERARIHDLRGMVLQPHHHDVMNL